MSWSTADTVTEQRDQADWIRGAATESEAQQYLEALRRNVFMVVLAVVVCLAAALLYLSRAEETYESSADVLVTPTFDRGTDIVGLSVIGTSGDPTRTVETAARLMTTPEVAARVRAGLRLDRSPSALRKAVTAVPVASSDVVTITAQASSAQQARRLADGFVQAAIAERTEQLHEQLDEAIPRVARRLAGTRDPEERAALGARLADFKTLREVPDRSVRPATRAELPSSPISPRPRLTIVVALIAGLMIGIGGVIALELLSPRVWREAQLRTRYRLPILARMPVAKLRSIGRPLRPRAAAALRGLRAALMMREDDAIGGRCVVVTSAADDSAKTVVAASLARSLAQAGKHVLLVEADPRSRLIDRRTQLHTPHGLLGVLSGEATLAEAAVDVSTDAGRMQVLHIEPHGDALADVMTGVAVHDLLADAEELADWVVVDAPQGDRVGDVLPLALAARHVLFAVGLGVSKTAKMQVAAETLAANNVAPVGFVVLGARGGSASS